MCILEEMLTARLKGREGGKVSFSCGCASYSHLSHSFQGDTPIFVGQETHTEGESSGNCKSVTIRTQREPGITLEAAQLEDGVTWGQHTVWVFWGFKGGGYHILKKKEACN